MCSNVRDFVNIIQNLAPYENAVFGAYVIPTAMINNTSGTERYSGQASPNTITKTFDKPSTLNGYTPKNKKLLTWPFCYMNVSNNNGISNSLHYEEFHDTEGQIYFLIKGIPVPRRFY